MVIERTNVSSFLELSRGWGKKLRSTLKKAGEIVFFFRIVSFTVFKATFIFFNENTYVSVLLHETYYDVSNTTN